MKRITAAATLAIAALSLSACTGGTSGPGAAETSADSAPVAIAATSAPADPSTAHVSSPSPSSDTEYMMAKAAPGMESPDETRQNRADAMLHIWLNFQGAHHLSDFNKPYSFIAGWYSPAPHVYAFTVDDAVEDYAAKNGSDVETELRKIGETFRTSPVGVNVQPKRVHVSTEDGKHETTVS
ncbi:hypothetical protein [Arthrobacter rhombi]|uniref:hypothetical protein n=1 Tax=Arthrobacter rhombi TaxID=71253 RepID=UPI003FD0C15C